MECYDTHASAPLQRIERVLWHNKICTLRGAKALLRNHSLTVNGRRIFDRTALVSCTQDIICLNGQRLFLTSDVYLMMNKIGNTVCTHRREQCPTVFDLVPESLVTPAALKRISLHCAGRLDRDTEGLLLLLSDGQLSHRLTTPRFCVPKTYIATLAIPVDSKKQIQYREQCQQGVVVEQERNFPAFTAAPAKLEWLEQNRCSITLTEGKFHEVKRLFKALGNTVIHLERIALGGVSLDPHLAPGKCRPLTNQEISTLWKATSNK